MSPPGTACKPLFSAFTAFYLCHEMCLSTINDDWYKLDKSRGRIVDAANVSCDFDIDMTLT